MLRVCFILEGAQQSKRDGVQVSYVSSSTPTLDHLPRARDRGDKASKTLFLPSRSSQTSIGKSNTCDRGCRGSRSHAVTRRSLAQRWTSKEVVTDELMKCSEISIRRRGSLLQMSATTEAMACKCEIVFRRTLSCMAFLEHEGEMDIAKTQEEGLVMILAVDFCLFLFCLLSF